MPHPSSRIFFVITLILVACAAVAVNAKWVIGVASSDSSESETARTNERAVSESRAMTTPLNAITSFDAALIRRWTIGHEPFTANQMIVADVSGTFGIDSFDATLISNYVANSENLGGNTGITVPPGLLMGDVSGSGPHYDGLPGTPAVSLPTMNAGGGVITVPVVVDDLTGLRAVSYDFQVTFDPAVLRPEGYRTGVGTLSNGVTVLTKISNPGHLIVSGYNANPLTGSGSLINLLFTAVGATGQSTALTFEDYTDADGRIHQGFLFNEGTPSVATTNGSVTLIPFTPTPTSTRTFTPTASPTPTVVSASLPAVNAASGSEITVPITVGDLTGLGVNSYDLQVTFDPAVVQPALPPTSAVGTLSEAAIVTPGVSFPGHIHVGAFAPPGQLTGSGTLINLKFTVVGTLGQSTSLAFENWRPPGQQPWPGWNGVYFNEGNPASAPTNGSVTIVEAPSITGTVTYGNAIGAPPTRFIPNVQINGAGSLPVSALTAPDGTYSLGGFGAGLYGITPYKTGGINGAITSFDAARITQHVVGISNLSPLQQFVADVTGSTGLTSLDAAMIAKFAAGPPYTEPGIGSTATWRFLPASRTHEFVALSIAGENYSAILMGEVSGNWTPSAARPVGGKQLAVDGGSERNTVVELPNLMTPLDKEINIPVTVNGVAYKDIISYEFNLRYDPSVIQPQEVAADLASTVSRGLSFVTNVIEPGLLRVVVYGPMPINDDGVLLNLRFTAVGKSGSASAISFERIMFNEGEPRVNATDGQVELF